MDGLYEVPNVPGLSQPFVRGHIGRAFFAKGSASVNPEKLTYTCEVCGEVVRPARWANGYLRAACPCSIQVRDKREKAQDRATVEQTAHATRAGRTYTWLGAHAEEPGLERLDFHTLPIGKQTKAFAFAARYLDGLLAGTEERTLLLRGPYGTGKTWLAAALANACRRQGIACLFASAQNLFNAYYDSGFDMSIIAQAAKTPLFVLDDLSQLYVANKDNPEERGEFQKKTLYAIFDLRYKAHLPSILTTNAADLTKWFDGATLDRMGERIVALTMEGESYRKMRKVL